ncbi:hypothetical protein CEXT_305911 [Caerostris extrusa]|uniref:Uncharacterized protein n=1 Tax=Caerostris extrusa TaxID=172846 RepID=A0AAV4VL60_CAEEX|nr:hypothetical protein CEXT_305911 [Caerostris extrusa]
MVYKHGDGDRDGDDDGVPWRHGEHKAVPISLRNVQLQLHLKPFVIIGSFIRDGEGRTWSVNRGIGLTERIITIYAQVAKGSVRVTLIYKTWGN